MITVQELRNKAMNLYKEVLRAEILKESFFPKSIRANKRISEDFVAINEELSPIIAESKDRKGFGFSIKYIQVRTRKHGLQDVPEEFLFENLGDYLKYVAKEKEFRLFQAESTQLLAQFPALRDWALKYPNRIIDNFGKWDHIQLVLNWFLNNHEAGKYYTRELPVNVHTKFIETHKGILRELLDVLLVNNSIPNESSFERRFGLKYPEPLVRVRLLDTSLVSKYHFSDVSIPRSEFAASAIPVKKAIITENLMNFLTLPAIPECIGIWGGGFRIEILKRIDWINRVSIYYWGDIDVHGMQILSQLRQYYPVTTALMMDMETLNQFKDDWGKSPVTNASQLPGLYKEEQELFAFLKTSNIRLEQEKIPQVYAVNKMRRLFES